MTFEQAEKFPFNPFDLTKVSLLFFLAETVALCGLGVGFWLHQTSSCCSKEWHLEDSKVNLCFFIFFCNIAHLQNV